MKKLPSILFLIVIMALSQCSKGESPETSFEKFKQAGCMGNADEALSRMDMKALAISVFKEGNPQAADVDIQAYITSPKYNEDVSQMTARFKKTLSQKDNDLCKMAGIKSEINGNTAIIHVQENPDNPYLIFKHIYVKRGNTWLWSSIDGLVNPPLYISSDTLYREYQSNVIAADQKYKGKAIQITGTINQIGKDIATQVYFTVGSGIMGDVQCFVKPSLIDKVASLKPGQNIEVTGICNGKLMIVELKECVF